ncbi:PhoPQ-activated pathogenicity-related family protein [Anaerobaca lacustris]|uniref:PhoPQ-activated pathogenicity-related family protein n=1 Tax=Anaerobaca lacustris TaxID=3044600 RepID=A0AAW6TZL5_9BACT|nr:PhoPQ-activated pathogenicity-related family protein [Sedimentisphaerales bacterium M17dextr]
MRTRKNVAILLTLFVVSLAVGSPLDDYVARPDPSYRYSLVRTIDHPQGKIYILDMTSQQWRSEQEVNRTLWQHWLTVVVPNDIAFDTALLWITGGSNDRPAPTQPDDMLANIALRSRSVVAELRTVPNQPLVFPDDPTNQRYEDAIIAYTFDRFLKTEDPTWPLLLPMVKSAVRAMDTVQDHLAKATDGKVTIKNFVVSGGSKRGWTTWLTAAVDKRVCAIAPVVIDVLNMNDQMRHHFAAYGFYSPAIGDYEQMKIFDRLDTDGGTEIRNFVDPYEYRNRYTMPKFLINSSGDQFFLPDSAQFYFADLPEEKHLLYCANTDHGLDGSDADKALLIWYQSILTGRDRPQFSWDTPESGHVVVTTQTRPQKVTLWTATNPQARDFRLEKIGKAWQSRPLTATNAGTYDVRIPAPDKGWTAYFVELHFDSGTPLPYRFSTEVRIVPDTLPYADKLKGN